MAWETALDRLLIRQIHLAEAGETRVEDVRRQVGDLWEINQRRPETAFMLGYARSLLGVELPMPDSSVAEQRWYTFGRLRGHDRRGERNWVADLMNDPQQTMELLSDPRIASQCLPMVMRTLFWSGNLDLAVKALAYLSSSDSSKETDVLVDAALSDLISRLERRVDKGDEESTLSILQKCVYLNSFSRLPTDIQARYLRALGQRLLKISEFQEALVQFEMARVVAPALKRMRSSLALLAALAEMRLHDISELWPRSDRSERDSGMSWLAEFEEDPKQTVPEAFFARGILEYEQGNYREASEFFDSAMRGLRRGNGRDAELIDRTNFFLAASLLIGGPKEEASRGLRLMDASLESVTPDLESFYSVHEALKEKDRKLALRFLDAVDIGRGTAPDQLLFVALEYLSLGEAEPASAAADQVLQVAVDLDQRIEAMRVLLTVHNMRGNRDDARNFFYEIRDLLMQRAAFGELEKLLKNEDFVGQALDHMEIKCELVDLYEEMEDRELEKATLQSQIARSLKARKDVEALHQAFALLREVEISFPELARDDLRAIEKHLELADDKPADLSQGEALVKAAAASLGHTPRVLVVGGNERQRRHHPRFVELTKSWKFAGEWLEANYSSPQKLVSTIGDRLNDGVDLLVLLHWNRHETTEPALELARKQGVMARTVHYAGFTSLQVCLSDQFDKLAKGGSDKPESEEKAKSKPASKGRRKAKSKS
ncbi:MAG: hypothetical protein ACYTG5_02710 [Planctomycetota bacterium]